MTSLAYTVPRFESLESKVDSSCAPQSNNNLKFVIGYLCEAEGICGSSLVSARDRKFLTTCSEENEQVFDVREEHMMRALACFAMDAIGAFVIIFGLLELRISNILMLCLMSNEKGSEAFSILSSEIRTINFFKQTFFNFNRLQTRNTFHKTYFSLFSELGGGF